MTAVGRTEDHQARCLQHVLTLRLLVRDGAEEPLPWLAAAEVTRATETILAEAQAASRVVRAAAGGAQAPEPSWTCG